MPARLKSGPSPESRVPGAVQHVARLRVVVHCRPGTVPGTGVWNGPGSAQQQHFVLQCARDT
jgi:hypothetical protein